jgi:DNA helicase-2/ATP-dependent DNA helicase PcrA
MKKGERALSAYFDAQHKTWGSNMKAEYAIDGVKVGEVPLRGRLDRIDLLGDPSAGSGRVRAVDYKFKKPMSRNQITGEVKNGDGNYYRQLTFYKLLVDEGTKWRMQDGMIDFLEPDARGKLKQEVFAPSDKEVAELKKEIVRVSEDILDLKFLVERCEKKDCKYCELKKE